MFRSLKTKITFTIAAVLLLCVTAYLFVGITLSGNIYRDKADNEITNLVKFKIGDINHRTDVLQKKARDLANAGEVFYRIQKLSSSTNLHPEMVVFLKDTIEYSPELLGGGIWYEPYVFYDDKSHYGPYAYWRDGEVIYTEEFSVPELDYHNQDWYQLALPADWDRSNKNREEFYWTHPHIDNFISDDPMIAVETFMYSDEDEDGEIIGIVSLDWSTEEMATFLENTLVTPDSHVFLFDKDNQHLLVDTLGSNFDNHETNSTEWLNILYDPQKNVIKKVLVTIGSVQYYAYYALTDVDLLFASLVPESVLTDPIKQLNKIDIIAASFFGILVVILLYLALARVTNPILKLTKAVERVSRGETDVELNVKSKDEIGKLVSGFNLMTKTLALQKQELEDRAYQLESRVEERTKEVALKNRELEGIKNSLEETVAKRVAELETLKNNLEKNVEERTKELGVKLGELERLNRIMVDREIKMISLKKEIKELKGEQVSDNSNFSK